MGENNQKNFFVDVFAGSVAGACQLMVGHPFDTIKVKLQSQGVSAGQTYGGPIDAVRRTLVKEGVPGLYRGFLPPLATVAAFNAILFSTRGATESFLAKDGQPMTLTDQFIAGMAAGVTVSFLATPTELFKCRLQAQGMYDPAKVAAAAASAASGGTVGGAGVGAAGGAVGGAVGGGVGGGRQYSTGASGGVVGSASPVGKDLRAVTQAQRRVAAASINVYNTTHAPRVATQLPPALRGGSQLRSFLANNTLHPRAITQALMSPTTPTPLPTTSTRPLGHVIMASHRPWLKPTPPPTTPISHFTSSAPRAAAAATSPPIPPQYRGPLDVMRFVYKHEGGVFGVFRGINITLIREVPGNGIMFSAYEGTKMAFAQLQGKPLEQLSGLELMTAGGVGGSAFWLFMYPTDVIKSKIQTDDIWRPKYGGNIWSTTKKIWADEGVAGFYKGFGPAMLRSFPANAVSFVMYELTMDSLRKMGYT